MYAEIHSTPMSEIELTQANDLADSTNSLGFEYIPGGPAQTLHLKCTNPDQLAVGSCHF